MSKINATIVADSINKFEDRISSLEFVFPRWILAELNTHRVFSRNLSSSRAIPFHRMLKTVLTDTFIPIAWQKEHKGMQGTEYLDAHKLYSIKEVQNDIMYIIQKVYQEDVLEDEPMSIEVLNVYNSIFRQYENVYKTLKDWWLLIRDRVIECAILLHSFGVSKQIANRLLEPFMYAKALVTSTEWENFFALRCPQYILGTEIYRSRKDWLKVVIEESIPIDIPQNEIEWLKINKGQAEIHMMALAEAIWDVMNESKPKLLKAGEWHIVYEDRIDHTKLLETATPQDLIHSNETIQKIKVTTGMAARASYTTIGNEKEVSYETLIGIHDKMVVADPFHASPFEHNNRCMNELERDVFMKRWLKGDEIQRENGWCRNFRGFIQYRHFIETGQKI